MGQFNNPTPALAGASIGQTGSPQSAFQNMVPESAFVDSGTGNWILNGTATAPNNIPAFSNAFFCANCTSVNGAADTIDSPAFTPAPVANAQKTLSFQFTAVPSQSPVSRVQINWSGGVARTDYVDVDSRTGVIVGAQNITAVNVSSFLSRDSTGAQITVYELIATTTAVPAGTNAGFLRITPRIDQPTGVTGSFGVGAFMIVEGDETGAYVITSLFDATLNRSLFGELPANTISPRFLVSVGNGNLSPAAAFNNGLVIVQTGVGPANDVTLPDNPNYDGTNYTIINGSAGSFDVQVANVPSLIFGPGFPAAGVAFFTMPSAATYPNCAVTLVAKQRAANRSETDWYITWSNIGPFSSGGIPIGATYAYNETPAGAVNGTTGSDGNATFTLANTPSPAGSLLLTNNGQVRYPTLAYTLAGNTITFLAPYIPVTGDVLLAVQYQY